MAFARLSVVRIGGYTLLMITALTAVNAVDGSIVLQLGPLSRSPVAKITARNHVSSIGTARSAVPAVGSYLVPPC